SDIKVFGGGGGTITHEDAIAMRRKGVEQIFFAGTSLTEMTDYVRDNYGKAQKKRSRSKSREIELARKLTEIEGTYGKGKRPARKREDKRAGCRPRRMIVSHCSRNPISITSSSKRLAPGRRRCRFRKMELSI